MSEKRMSGRLLKAVYFGGILAQIVIRMPYEQRRRTERFTVDRVTGQERALVGVLFLGSFFIPAVYALTPWLNGADYRWSPRTKVRAGGIGTIILAAALWLFRRAHVDLGPNWSPSLQLRSEHELVTRGVYRRIRHPMYASQWLWSIAQPLLLQNRIAGWSSAALFLPLYLVRLPREESMLVEQFGDAYRAYMQQTGRILPHRWWS